MPETTKTQPWKAHWPPPTSAEILLIDKGNPLNKKPGEILEVDGTGGAAYGYNEKGEGIAGPKEPKDDQKL